MNLDAKVRGCSGKGKGLKTEEAEGEGQFNQISYWS